MLRGFKYFEESRKRLLNQLAFLAKTAAWVRDFVCLNYLD